MDEFCSAFVFAGVYRSSQISQRVRNLEAEVQRLCQIIRSERQFSVTPGAEGSKGNAFLGLVLPMLTAAATQQQDRSVVSLDHVESSAGIAGSYAGARSFAVSLMDSFGRYLAVWIGGVAIILSGFFLVKYSVESGLLSPMVRVGLSVVFNMLLVVAGFLHHRCAIANQLRIVQALTGSAVAILYAAIFSAFNMYQFLGLIKRLFISLVYWWVFLFSITIRYAGCFTWLNWWIYGASFGWCNCYS